MDAFKSSPIVVSVFCGAGSEPPNGENLVYNRANETFYLPNKEPTSFSRFGEPWCTQEVDAHIDDVDTFDTDDAARKLEKEGWSFNGEKWCCPHCTKRIAGGAK